MRIDIISAVPSLLESPFNDSIIQRAKTNGLVEICLHNLRDYTHDKHNKIDDYQFGGGAGMVLTVEPLYNCISKLQKERSYDEIIYMTPDGEKFDQRMANTYSLSKTILIICGHYKGIDDRIREHFVTKEITVGDFVLSGGELPAAVFTDAVVRLIPGVIGDEQSALTDSFQDDLLAPPVYSRPADFMGWEVPEILRSGNLKAIEEWRFEQAIERTKTRRPDLLDN